MQKAASEFQRNLLMFPKRQRISKGTFAKTTQNGRRVTGTYLTVTKNNIQQNEPSRFAVVVLKKVAAKAVTRNLIRRRVYHILHTLLKKDTGHTYVVFAKKKTDEQTHTTLQKELTSLLS